jgi:hypothetical protein
VCRLYCILYYTSGLPFLVCRSLFLFYRSLFHVSRFSCMYGVSWMVGVSYLVSNDFFCPVKQSGPGQPKSLERLECLLAAADAVCDADLVDVKVRSQQRWDLLTTHGMLNVRVGSLSKGYLGFPSFPSWLGRNSTAGKRKRLLSSLCLHMNSRITGGRTTVRLEYLPVLRSRLLAPMVAQQEHGVEETVGMLDEYGTPNAYCLAACLEFLPTQTPDREAERQRDREVER